MEPYASSSVGEQKNEVSTITKVWISITALISCAFYFSIYQSVPKFVDVFDSFAIENSLVIEWLFNNYFIFLPISLISLLPLVIWMTHPLLFKYQNKIKNIAIHNIILSCLALVIVQVALYQPIIEMGEAL